MQLGKKTMVIICVFFVLGMISTVQAAKKSVYAVTNHSYSTIGAFEIVNNEIEYQTDTNLDFGSGAVGLAIDPDSWTIFTSYDGSYNIGIINAKTMEPEEDPVVVAPWELVGIVWDNTVDRLYGMRREGSTSLDNIVIYEWDPVSKELTQDGDTIKLPSFPNNGMGITLDEDEALLYATDNTNTVYVYDTSEWSFIDSFGVNVDGNDRKCVAIAVYNDGAGNSWVYTGGYSHTSGDHDYLVKTSTESPYTSSEVDVEDHVSGVTVDAETGLIYITSFHQDIRVYDSNLILQYSDGNNVDGNPADICLAGDVSYKPPLFTLQKIDVNEPNSVLPGDYITYEITYGPNGFDHNDVILTDYLSFKTDFNSASGPNSVYDSNTHTVTWNIGHLDADDPCDSVSLTVKVNEGAEPNSVITNYCEIESDSAFFYATADTNVGPWQPDSEIIYVDSLSPCAPGTGMSWRFAYRDLQDALERAAAGYGNEIWVAAGTYKPTTVLEDWYATFELADGVAIYGGFAGSETSRNQRNWMINETILDGNLPDYGVSYVVRANDVNETATIDGFTIKKAWWASIKVDNSSLTIEHNKIKENGYGIYCINQSSVNITNCEITDNVGRENVDGGGIYCRDSNDLTVTDCVISKNTTDANGGGIYCEDSNNLTVTNCIITDNEAENRGGGVYDYNSLSSAITNCTFSGNSAGYGGAVLNNSSDPNITNCIFTGNTAGYAYGGGMYNYNESMPTIVNCIFTGNASTSWDGGGMYNYQSSPTLINCTFSKNSAGRYGGGMLNNESSPNVTNCIFWGNDANGSGDEIYNHDTNSVPNFSYCDIKGIFNTEPEYGGYDSIDGGDNINSDPNFLDVNTPTGSWTANASYDSSTYQSTLTDANASWSVDELACNFIDPNTSQYLQFFIVSNDANTIKVWGDVTSIAEANDTYEIFDYRLSADSNCIDAGDPNGDYDDQADIYGEPREVNGRVDIGADEYYVADWVFCIKNGLGVPVAWFDDSGNLFLKGIFEPNTTPEASANDEFRFQDSNSNDVAIIDANSGNMYIEGLLQAQWQDPNGQNDEFIIEDSNAQPVSYINDSGNVFLKGKLYDDIWP